jgi:hypothetical protein
MPVKNSISGYTTQGCLKGGAHVSRAVVEEAGDVPPQLPQAQLHEGVAHVLVHRHVCLAVEPAARQCKIVNCLVNYPHLKGLSQELDLAFDDMYAWLVLGLNRGRGQVLNFLAA